MRGLLAVIVLLVIVFFGVPMVAAGTTNACQALERHDVSNTAANVAGGTSGPVYNTVNAVGQMGTTGNTAATAENTAHPNTPSPISCTVDYWKTLI